MALNPMSWEATPANWNKTLVILLIESTAEQKKYSQIIIDLYCSFKAPHFNQPCSDFKKKNV